MPARNRKQANRGRLSRFARPTSLVRADKARGRLETPDKDGLIIRHGRSGYMNGDRRAVLTAWAMYLGTRVLFLGAFVWFGSSQHSQRVVDHLIKFFATP